MKRTLTFQFSAETMEEAGKKLNNLAGAEVKSRDIISMNICNMNLYNVTIWNSKEFSDEKAL